MPPKAIVYILLGTFNGASFLRQQIESIQGQSISNWRLLIRDDGSSDGTLDILERFAISDQRICILRSDHRRLGVTANYGELMRAALECGANITCFSDQDDVWLPSKLVTQIKVLADFEAKYHRDTPILIYSDLEVVGERLQTIHHSFMKYRKISHEIQRPLQVLLVQNFVNGCGVMINRSLLELAVPVPSNVLMHDWWVSLCAAACGVIGFQPNPTVLYRQHAANVVGAKGWWPLLNPFRRDLFMRWRSGTCTLVATFEQACELSRRIVRAGENGIAEIAEMCNAYGSCASLPPIKRLFEVYRLKISPQGTVRRMLFYFRLLTLSEHHRS